MFWFLLACAVEAPGDPEPVPLADVPALTVNLADALESRDRSLLDQALDEALSRVGEDSELDQLLLQGSLVHGNPTRMDVLQRGRGGIDLDFFHPVVEQVVARAVRGEATWTDLENAIQDCDLLDRSPSRGLQAVHRLAVEELPEVAYGLGALRVTMGRPERRTDPETLEGRGDLRCRDLRRVEGSTLPDKLPRRLLVAATDGTQRLYVSVRAEDGESMAFVSNRARDAERLLDAGLWWAASGPERTVQLVPLYGEGLIAP